MVQLRSKGFQGQRPPLRSGEGKQLYTGSQREHSPAQGLIQIAGLWDYEKIHVCCLKLSSVGDLPKLSQGSEKPLTI